MWRNNTLRSVTTRTRRGVAEEPITKLGVAALTSSSRVVCSPLTLPRFPPPSLCVGKCDNRLRAAYGWLWLSMAGISRSSCDVGPSTRAVRAIPTRSAKSRSCPFISMRTACLLSIHCEQRSRAARNSSSAWRATRPSSSRPNLAARGRRHRRGAPQSGRL